MKRIHILIIILLISCSSNSSKNNNNDEFALNNCEPEINYNIIKKEECLSEYTGSVFNYYISCEKKSYIVYKDTGKYFEIYCQKNESKICYKNGQHNSFFKENNKIHTESKYLNGIQSGFFISWYKNGQKYCEGIAENSYWNGNVSCWYRDGNPMLIGNYLNGYINGESIGFDKYGNTQTLKKHLFSIKRMIE